jgi:molecular chaperone HscB
MTVDSQPTHFDIFALPRSFDVDPGQLDSRFRELQRTVHPDRFVNATDQERRISMQQATRINEAYQTLKDPLLRGRYLLKLGGREFHDEQHTTSDVEFLMEQMELREALGEVRNADDVFAELGRIIDRISGDVDALTASLRQQFHNGGPGSQDKAADLLTKMQFFRRLQEEAMELEAVLEDDAG